MTETITPNHLEMAVQHLSKIRDYLVPRHGWQVSEPGSKSLAAGHGSTVLLADAVRRLMRFHLIEPELEGLQTTSPEPVPQGELDAAQLAKMAGFVSRMQSWFAERSRAPLPDDGAAGLQRIYLLLLEILRALEAVMLHNQVAFVSYEEPDVPVGASGIGKRPAGLPLPEGAEEASDLPDHLARLCAKCGWPRETEMNECPNCGVLYDRALQQVVDERESDLTEHDVPAADDSQEMEPLEALPRPPAADLRRPAPSPLERFRSAIDADIWVFVAAAAVVYLGVMVAISSLIAGGTGSMRDSKKLFLKATDRKLLYPFDNGAAVNFVDHRLAMYSTRDGALFLYLYYEGPLARKTDLEVLRETAYEAITLMQIPTARERTMRRSIGGQSVDVEVMRIGDEDAPPVLGFLSTFHNQKGRPVVVFLWGPRKRAVELAGEVFLRE